MAKIRGDDNACKFGSSWEPQYLKAPWALPSKEAIEKILRYESALERQLYKAIDQLERLQRSRQGDLVPPPVNIQVSNAD